LLAIARCNNGQSNIVKTDRSKLNKAALCDFESRISKFENLYSGLIKNILAAVMATAVPR
jgi:hypothetical protein